MITAIIAGGSGTRLWPLSTPDYPKHLLRLNGQNESLLQSTYERVKGFSKKVYVITDASHAKYVREQLPEIKDDMLVVEPARRGTASCIVAGLVRISNHHNDNDEPVAFVHADHYIRDKEGFQHSFAVAAEASRQENRIVLVGVEPDYPATGFGYIKKGKVFDEKTFVFEVGEFKEKPEFDVAKQYFKSGNYLWNCGYFVASVKTFLDKMQKYSPELFEDFNQLKAAKDESQYKDIYLGFENIAIDYALIEKVDDLLVTPAAFDWMDIGSYSDLHKAVESSEAGNHVHGEKVETEDIENCFIQNHEDKPVAVIGLDNIVVVNTPHGVLVARKDLSQKVGDISKRFTK